MAATEIADPVREFLATDVHELLIDGETVWSRAAEGDFPPLPELKGRIRDRVASGRSLGHTDRRTR